MISMPSTPVILFLSVVLAAIVLLITAEGAGARQAAISKASADVSCI